MEKLATAHKWTTTTEPALGADICDLAGVLHTVVICNIHEELQLKNLERIAM